MPYTTHGHWYGDSDPTEPGPDSVARCGGPAICQQCATQAGRLATGLQQSFSGSPVGSREAQIRASDRLEELTAEMKDFVQELRDGMNRPDAYRKVYNLRRELSRVVASLGVGVP